MADKRWKTSKNYIELSNYIKSKNLSLKKYFLYPESLDYASLNYYMNIDNPKDVELIIDKLKGNDIYKVFQYTPFKICIQINKKVKTVKKSPVIELWNNGMKVISHIAKELNITTYQVKKELQKEGIK
jgi:hypothetical protein